MYTYKFMIIMMLITFTNVILCFIVFHAINFF